MALDKTVAEGWPRGVIRAGDRTLIPEDGLFDLINGLYADDGVPYERAGSAYRSNAAFGGSSGLRQVWNGDLAGGLRSVFYDPNDLGQLQSDGATPALVKTGYGAADPRSWAIQNGILYLELAGSIIAFAGSRKSADYSTGTVDLVKGSQTVTGHGTSWNANADAGMILERPSGTRRVAVQSIDSNTSLTLVEPWSGPDETTVAYTLYVARTIITGASVVGVAAIAGRLLYLWGDRMYYSETDDVGNIKALNFHSFEALGLGLSALRDDVLIFTNRGTWAISGMANDIADPAGNPLRRQELVNKELILWHRSGLAHWRNALIVPARDGIWLMDSVSGPVKISDAIAELYRSYVLAGYRPGGGHVEHNHYWLPILDSSVNVIDLLVCRLTETRAGPAFAWSRFQGSGANVTALTSRRAEGEGWIIFGAGRQSSSRVLRLDYFTPSAALKRDHDGGAKNMELITGDVGTGNMVANLVRRLRASYSLVADTGDAPYVEGSAAKDGGSYAVLTGPRGESGAPATKAVFTWPIKRLRARYARIRLRTVGPCASASFRSIEKFIRHSGRY